MSNSVPNTIETHLIFLEMRCVSNGINLSVTKNRVMGCEIDPDAPRFRRFHDSQEKRKGRLSQGLCRATRGFPQLSQSKVLTLKLMPFSCVPFSLPLFSPPPFLSSLLMFADGVLMDDF